MANDHEKTAKTPKELTPAARRALVEAEERRAAAAKQAEDRPEEINGPKGEEPTRYGDWERNGIASDF
ncbi:MAG: DUF1674 domain-containing protein [Candidatus Phaeomarinobacter sp.]